MFDKDAELPSPVEASSTAASTGPAPHRTSRPVPAPELGFYDESSTFHAADAVVYAQRLSRVLYMSGVEPAAGFYDATSGGFLAGESGFDPTSQALGLVVD